MSRVSSMFIVLGLVVGLPAGTPGPATAGGEPTIFSTSIFEGPTDGNDPLVIFGENFGPSAGSVTLGPWTCPIDGWSETTIQCRTPPGYGAQNFVIVNPAAGGASAPWYYSYLDPFISDVTPFFLAPDVGAEMVLTGDNFGIPGAPLYVEFGGVPGTIVSNDHHSARVRSPGGLPGAVSLVCLRMGPAGEESCEDMQFGNPIEVGPPSVAPPFGLRLAGANPSRGSTEFAIDLSRDARYALDVFDSAGRLIRRFAGDGTAGTQVVRWDGATAGGARVPAGLYWARLEVAGERFVRKVMRL